MKWWGYLFWALVPLALGMFGTKRENIGGVEIEVRRDSAPIRMLERIEAFRVLMLKAIILVALPPALWGLVKWLWQP